MILFYADVHFGVKSYSTQQNNGLFTSEQDTLNSLEFIYERSKCDDIDLIICGGDIFHTNHPSTINIMYMIEWLQKMDSVGKPHYLIPGNHDAATYSNSLIYGKKLILKNTKIIEEPSFSELIWNDMPISFIPYIPSNSYKDKDSVINNELENFIKASTKKSIIVSHIQEYSSKIGSEANMLSRGVDIYDINESEKEIILLTGHIHRAQTYKKGSITIVYPGSTTYTDLGDLNTIKGVCIISDNGEVAFEPIKNIRKMVKYSVPEDSTTNIFKNMRISKNQLVVLEVNSVNKIDEQEFIDFFKERDSVVIKFKYKSKDDVDVSFDSILPTNNDPNYILSEYAAEVYKNQGQEVIDRFISVGKYYIDGVMK